MLAHTDELSPEARSPIAHYRDAVNASFGLLSYVRRHLESLPTYPAIRSKHLALLQRFILANLIETFERFLKELASICIDQLAPYLNDDRYDGSSARGNELIAHFEAGSIGKALCESDTWLSNKSINERFRKLLASTDGTHWAEYLFPLKNQTPKEQASAAETLAILWQIRHTMAHNSGVLTGSDAMKLRALSKGTVAKDRLLAPTEDDLRFVKTFLTDTASETNRRVAMRLAALLSDLHSDNPSLFDASTIAEDLAQALRVPVSVAGCQASP